MTAVVLVLASLPCVYWSGGVESRATVEAASIPRICVAAEQADSWRGSRVSVTPVSAADLASRETLPVPGVTTRAGVASPTRAPWIVANGWRFMRAPSARYLYDAPPGSAALAIAEAFAYGADAMVKVDPTDLNAAAAMLTFLDGIPPADLPPIADLGVVDDGSAVTGEVMNLLARRNLLFQAVKSPAAQYRLNIVVGSREYPVEAAADPSAFALKVRRQLTDEQRSVRVFGSEVVICRFIGDGRRARLHLLNYSGRDIDGLRVRLRGAYRPEEARVAGSGTVTLQDVAATNDAVEFSIPRLGSYAVIELTATR